MRRRQSGFGLLEATFALALGLVLLAATSPLVASAHQSWLLQGAASRLQDDARLALLRMAQDIRLAGMFGCLRLQAGDFNAPSARQAFARPLEIGPASLSLVVAELPGHTGPADWTLLTDCRREARVESGRYPGTDQLMAIPISRIRYALSGTTLMFTRRDQSQSLVDHVQEMRVALVPTPQGGRVDLQLTMYDPSLQIEQRHALSVTLRNPVAGP
jgi:type IV pilus assembly protein PilW